MNNNLTPETYNIEAAYQIVMADCGATYLGDYAKSWNKQLGSLLVELCLYAQRKQLPNPTNVVMMDKPKTTSRVKPIIKKSPNGSITLAATRLEGTSLETATEIRLETTEDGRVYLINASLGSPQENPVTPNVEEAKLTVSNSTLDNSVEELLS